jgi:pimeloyl-ACP methyl ester carboxylesterase
MVDLAFTESGNGPAAVLLHAFPLTSLMWSRARTTLADQWRVITPDLRGFGGSPLGTGDEPSLDHMADDVAALLDRLALEQVVLGGLSMGGYVAMSFLRRYPDRISALVLANTKPTPDTPEARRNRERVAAELAESGTPEPLLGMVNILLSSSTRERDPGTVAQVQEWIKTIDPAAAIWAQRAMAARPDSRPTLAAATCPAAVIAGEEDAVTPLEEATAMAELFHPPAVIRVVPRAGHLSVVEQPVAAVDALRDVLAQVTSPR